MADEEQLNLEEDLEDGEVAKAEAGTDADDEGGEGKQPEDRGDAVEKDEDPGTDDLQAVAGEDAETEDDSAGRGSRVVPHARFNEVNEKLKASEEARIRAEERARILEEQAKGGAKPEKATAPAAFDFDAKEDEYAEAMMDGDRDKAKALRREINAELRRQADQAAVVRASEQVAIENEKRAFNDALSSIYARYPVLDNRKTGANQDAINDAVEFRDLYLAKGKTPTVALNMAADRVVKLYKLKQADAKDDDEGEGETEDEATQAEKRARASLARNAESAKRQPASLSKGGVGERATASKVQIEDLSDEDFGKLPASVKARMRGDVL